MLKPAEKNSASRQLVPTLSQAVYDYLKQHILDETYRPGQALRQEEIALQLEVSRVPVRESLKRLEAEGLVTLRPRRGFTVTELDVDDITDVIDICVMLEGRAGYEAARRRTVKDVDRLEMIWRDLLACEEEAQHSDEPEVISRWVATHRHFHDVMFQSSGRKNLCRLIGTARDALDRYIRAELARSKGIRTEHDAHEEMLEAFRAGNSERLQMLCASHIKKTGSKILEAIS